MTNPPRIQPALRRVALFVVGAAAASGLRADEAPGRFRLTVVDAATGRPTPARVELLDAAGNGQVARDALPVGGDGEDRPAPLRDTPEAALARLSRRVENPYTKTVQCYTGGTCEFEAPPGAYRLRVEKGIEYRAETGGVELGAGGAVARTVALKRWIDLPAAGWHSADDHLHIARPVPEIDPHIARWMQAEDVRVANLLQWGVAARFHNTLQYAFGKAGLYQDGGTILAAGQENPRTHFLGHLVILGAPAPIDLPDRYLLYAAFLDEAKRQGAVAGYAHAGTLGATPTGVAMDLAGGLLGFLEVMQFNKGSWGVWYDVLNTGFRVAPTAGTDYPYGPSLPGRERFYTRVEGPLTYAAWLEGIRRGRTFVTNGPAPELNVAGAGIGDDVVLERAGTVAVEARVRFDPERDRMEKLELIENGLVARVVLAERGADEIRLSCGREVGEACWLAVRATGRKADGSGPSAAHTAPVYVTVKGRPGPAEHPRAKALARQWAARLEELEQRLAEGRVGELAEGPESDRVEAAVLLRQREGLLKEVRAARERLLGMGR